MYIKSFFKLCLVMSLTYVTLGDEFLPQPYSSSSQKVRSEINEFLIGLLPNKEFNTLKNTTQTIQQFEQGEFSSFERRQTLQ
ncbi:hypothetical protein Sta7437_3252 [Stanieria cyanosphaera PCC 7437]|uniref:Uncharacterized protein n=1 Tax=Stanieria cyanosphaera (strain ATCC 29371 / PCC 7437) TaxID=111780 RepID=K9XXH2_STAC7|nr:hypothetical protein [Stanieria cyanosphaera]AFZ36759.1 hypothetical protein Sta7437_3252 [Stanieria cyanosphaera PCC 7437]